jgi:hypothetical protein
VRQAWLSLFWGFVVFQLVLVGIGVFFAMGGRELGIDTAKRLDAMRQVFQSCTTVGVIAVIFIARAKLHPDAIKSPADLFRGTLLCLIIGEITVLLALVGLSKLHLGQFLMAAGLVFLADFALVLPAGLKILAQPVQKK